MINIDEQELKNRYKDIETTCYTNGELVPFLIDRNLPPEYGGLSLAYRLPENEIIKIYNESSFAIKEKLKQSRYDRLEIAYEDNMKKVYEYYENELLQFMVRHPQFNSIIKEETEMNYG